MIKNVNGVDIVMTAAEEADFELSRIPDPAHVAQETRLERNTLLSDTDYTQLADYPQVDQVAMSTYRQNLRDVPAQTGFPENVTWPEKP